jgi:hypothetical protein
MKNIIFAILVLSTAYYISLIAKTDESRNVIIESGTVAWMKCTAGLEGDKCNKGTATEMSWQEADSYCSGLKLDGRKWRLPTQSDLMSIRKIGKPAPLIDVKKFPNTVQESYWGSKNEYGGLDFVDFKSGMVGSYSGNSKKKKFVRCASDVK